MQQVLNIACVFRWNHRTNKHIHPLLGKPWKTNSEIPKNATHPVLHICYCVSFKPCCSDLGQIHCHYLSFTIPDNAESHADRIPHRPHMASVHHHPACNLYPCRIHSLQFHLHQHNSGIDIPNTDLLLCADISTFPWTD